MLEYIFVYGTLKPGLRFHYLCQDIGLISAEEAYLENFDLYHLEPENYPAILAGEGNVQGFILGFVDIKLALEVLDNLEGIDHSPPHYFRQKVIVNPQNIQAWAYVYNINNETSKSRLEPVPSGIWLPKDS